MEKTKDNNQRLKIALVDSNRVFMEKLERKLITKNFDVVFTSENYNSESLLAALPDLALISCRGAGKTCLNLIQKFSRNYLLKDLPFIIVLEKGSPLDPQVFFQKGALDVVTLPVDLDLLLFKLSNLSRLLVPRYRIKLHFLAQIEKFALNMEKRGYAVFSCHIPAFPTLPENWSLPLADLIAVKENRIVIYEFVSKQELLDPGLLNNWITFNHHQDIHLRIVYADKETRDYLRKLLKEYHLRAGLISLSGIKKKVRKRLRKPSRKTTLIILTIIVILGFSLSLLMGNYRVVAEKVVKGIFSQFNRYEPKDLQREDLYKQLLESTKKKQEKESIP